MSDEPADQSDEMPEHETTEHETPETTEPGAGGRTVPAGALIVAIMVAAALGILAVVALTVDGGGGDDGELEAARLAAGRFGERLLTVDEDQIDEWKSGVLSLSTGGFAEEVDEVEESFRRLISEAELDVRAQVTEIFMSPIDGGEVSAILLYDREISDAGGTRTESDRYVQMRLLKVEGEWLVDNVIDIVSAEVTTGGAPDPAPATDPDPEPTDDTEPTPTTEAPPGE